MVLDKGGEGPTYPGGEPSGCKKILMSNLQKTESVSEHCPSLITYMTMVCVIMTVVGASGVLFLCIVFL